MRNRFIIFIAGLLSSMAFAPSFFWPLWLVAITVLLYYIEDSATPIQAFSKGWLFGFGHFLSGVYWIAIAPTHYAEFTWAAPLALIGIPAFLALFIAFIAMIAFFFKEDVLYSLNFAVIWVVFEWLREWLFTGFPWNTANYVMHFNLKLIQASDSIGPYGLSFICMLTASVFINILHRRYLIFATYLLIASALITCLYKYGDDKLKYATTNSELYVRLVQPSIPQNQKWSSTKLLSNLMLMSDMSKRPSEHKIDFVIWPEAAVVVDSHHPQILPILQLSINEGSHLISGGITEKEDFTLYSSVYAIDKMGDKLFTAHKHHLVPFGEYMPLKDYLPLKKLTPGLVDYTPGENEVLNFNGLKIKPLICYEAIFPSEVRVNEAGVIFLHLTNDAYYGNSSGPYQHLEKSRARAIENGASLLRAGNNGISAIIDYKGQVLQASRLNAEVNIDGFIPNPLSELTLYSNYGNILSCFFIICLAICSAIMLRTIKKYTF